MRWDDHRQYWATCWAACGEEASMTCSSRSASTASSRVPLNASSSCTGRSLMKPAPANNQPGCHLMCRV